MAEIACVVTGGPGPLSKFGEGVWSIEVVSAVICPRLASSG